MKVPILFAILATLVFSSNALSGGEGACCLCDGSCIVMSESECAAQEPGGCGYGGDDTVCDPNPCCQFIGACCLDDGVCIKMDACKEACTALGGEYFPDVACDPTPCPTPVLDATWGEIKAIYR